MITSTRNRHVRAVRRLHQRSERKERGLTILEGPNLLEAALAAGVDVLRVYTLDPEDVPAHLSVEQVSPKVLEAMSATRHPRGPLALIHPPAWEALAPTDTLVLYEVGEPGNAGTLIRSAAAFGFAVAVTADTVDPWSPRVLRAGSGAHFATPVSRLGHDPLVELTEAGLETWVTVPAGGTSPSHLPASVPIAVVIGNEARGVPRTVIDDAAGTTTIEMPGAMESLNVAIAGSIVMYERRRGTRRRSDGPGH